MNNYRNTLVNDTRNWCNDNPDFSCDKHSYCLLAEPNSNRNEKCEIVDIKTKCIVCNKDTVEYTDLDVLHSPKLKYIARNSDKFCHTLATVSTCNEEKCATILDKVSDMEVNGNDEWDMWDEILLAIDIVEQSLE